MLEAAMRKKYKSPYLLRQVNSFVDIITSIDTSAIITWQDEKLDTGAEKEAEPMSSETDIAQNAAACGAPSEVIAESSADERTDGASKRTSAEIVSESATDGGSVCTAAERGATAEDAVVGSHEEHATDTECDRIGNAARNAPEPAESESTAAECASAGENTAARETEKDGENAANDAKYKERYAELLTLFTERFGYTYPKNHLTVLPEKMSISRLSPNVLDGADGGETDGEEQTDGITKIDASPKPKKRRLGKYPSFYSGKEDSESAKRGIATHNVLQFMKPELLLKDGTDAEIERLVKDGFLTKKDAEKVYADEIGLFRASTLFSEMLDAHRAGRSLYREFRFSVMLPASLFATKPEAKKKYAGEEILLQGVIDCIYEDANGDLHLVDYKTDRLTERELSDKALAQKKLSDAHSLQLTYYAIAIKRMLGRFPKTARVYSLPLGDTVDVSLGEEIEEYKSYCEK